MDQGWKNNLIKIPKIHIFSFSETPHKLILNWVKILADLFKILVHYKLYAYFESYLEFIIKA